MKLTEHVEICNISLKKSILKVQHHEKGEGGGGKVEWEMKNRTGQIS